MKQFDFYEFAALLVPGATAIVAILTIVPGVLGDLSLADASVGGVSILLLLAYAAGHLVQAVGNLVEAGWWAAVGGRPTDWPRTGRRQLISQVQKSRLEVAIGRLLASDNPQKLNDLTGADWHAIVREMYTVVAARGGSLLVDRHNGTYGLCRGLVAAGLLSMALVLITHQRSWDLLVLLAIPTILAAIRMHRFAVYYAQELMLQFLNQFHKEHKAGPTP